MNYRPKFHHLTQAKNDERLFPFLAGVVVGAPLFGAFGGWGAGRYQAAPAQVAYPMPYPYPYPYPYPQPYYGGYPRRRYYGRY